MTHFDDCETQEMLFEGVFSESEFQRDHYQIHLDKDVISPQSGAPTTWYHACLVVGTEWNSYQTVCFESSKNSKQETLDSMRSFRDTINEAITALEQL